MVPADKVRATTIRLTPRDQANVDRLMELSGHETMAAAIRYAIRRTLWELEALARGAAAQGKPKLGAVWLLKYPKGRPPTIRATQLEDDQRP